MNRALTWSWALALVMLVGPAGIAPAPAIAADNPPYAATEQNRATAAAALQEVDELLKRASEITGLPVRRPVRSALASRESTRRYIRQRLKEAAGDEKLRAQEIALKKFGLLPPDYDLQSATEQLLTEQAAAYYDPKRQQIYIADWTPVELQRPAIVHELKIGRASCRERV